MSRWSTAAVPLLVTAALAGCTGPDAAPPASGGEPPLSWVLPEVPKVDAKVLLANHKTFVKTYPIRADNVDTHKGARDALAGEFEEAGLEVFRHAFRSGIDQENVCGLKIGVGAPTHWIVVAGHYDTTTWDSIVFGEGMAPGHRVSEGAYDDGSGTRITVEIAKAFATIDSYYSIAFCAFDGEERGLQGSRAIFTAMEDSSEWPYDVDATRGMVDFDMFGICWPVRAPIYLDTNNAELEADIQKVRKAIGIPDEMFKKSGLSLGQSDYAHWYGTTTPTAFYISDFEELGVPTPVPNPATPAIPGAYPWWHWVDTVETMTLMAGGPDMLQRGFQTAVDLGVATVALLALHPELDFGVEPA